ncbi:hypothetical protein C9374_012384 [Naegleria lovaniensis]|uniref:non-specific serine/threonine protein kinase n=1 Tax=Naegleria lovaniensis TaxID=51637 RepID=A0AA88H2U2_NAELO|nr:uncharacterized protein C9374_012384 [Naegleria lovaniensis]KAG2392132.1 hypothetical protein C9374_012384 [Naegleria lovaniensis]
MGRKKAHGGKITLSLAQFQDQMIAETELLISEGWLEHDETSTRPNSISAEQHDPSIMNNDHSVNNHLKQSVAKDMMTFHTEWNAEKTHQLVGQFDHPHHHHTTSNHLDLADEVSGESTLEADLRLALALQEEEDYAFASHCANREYNNYHPMRVSVHPGGGIQIGGNSGFDLQQRCTRANQLKVMVVEDESYIRKNPNNQPQSTTRRNSTYSGVVGGACNMLFDDYELCGDDDSLYAMMNGDFDEDDEEDEDLDTENSYDEDFFDHMEDDIGDNDREQDESYCVGSEQDSSSRQSTAAACSKSLEEEGTSIPVNIKRRNSSAHSKSNNGNSSSLDGSSHSFEKKKDNSGGRLPKKQYLENNINRVVIPSHVRSAIYTSERKQIEKKIKEGNKMEDRATVEGVMDKKTRMMLYKFRNNGTLDSINGCCSTGKEANVYHATAGQPYEGNVIENIPGASMNTSTTSQGEEASPHTCSNNDDDDMMRTDLAIKIYKTSVLEFRDRDRYVTGDRRFKHGYCKSNPRKMVSVWAEKELRNLRRMDEVGIRVPKVIALKQHILIMEFIGKGGRCAPRLKEANIPNSKLKPLYLDIIKTMRTMYHKAKLIHADLSEYNILLYKGIPYYIDVSQSVEHDHPHALEFLRKDCENIKNFFERKGLGLNDILTTKELFDFVTDVNISEEIIDGYLDKMFSKIEKRPPVLNEQEQVQAEIFKQVFIPRALIEIEDPLDHQSAVDTDDVFFYKSVTGINDNLTASTNIPYGLTAQEMYEITGKPLPEEEEQDDENDNDESNDKNTCDASASSSPHLDQHVDPNDTSFKQDRKEWKQLVKQQNREKRQNKTPKKVKKQILKHTTRKP